MYMYEQFANTADLSYTRLKLACKEERRLFVIREYMQTAVPQSTGYQYNNRVSTKTLQAPPASYHDRPLLEYICFTYFHVETVVGSAWWSHRSDKQECIG